MLDELEHIAQHKELHKGNACIGQQAAKHDQRQRKLLFMAVQAGGDKSPGLIHQPGQHQQHRHHHQHLERHKKRREHAHRNQLGAGRHMFLDGVGDEVDQTIGAGPEHQQRNADANAVDAVQQAVTQLHQVLHKRLLGAGQFVFFSGFGHDAKPRQSQQGFARLKQQRP